MKDSKPMAIHACQQWFKAGETTEDYELADKGMYQSALGSLQNLSTLTKPDIAYAVSNVAKLCAKPTMEHWIAVKGILRYSESLSTIQESQLKQVYSFL